MYAVINSGGKQAKVEQGTIVAVERLSAEVGDTVSLPVIFVADGDTIYATAAELAGASVTALVLEHFKGEKQIVFKFKKRKGYKRTKGHRQTLTSLRVTDISLDGEPAKAKKPAPKAEKPAPKAKKPAPKAEKPAPVEAATDEARLCAAVKADGSPCTNKAKDGSEYCGVHAKK
ncbi:MAG: 50S ribosomal protein L21 [Coriobacteriia bacterium]|nr:50S ribosomal protein L21 [Coriobacteriia bacterium]